MKVLLVSYAPSNRGGIGNWVRIIREYADAHSQACVDISIISTSISQIRTVKRNFWNRFVINGLNIIRVKKEIKKYCMSNRVDVIHVTAAAEWSVLRDISVLTWASKHNIPTIYHLHFGDLSKYASSNNILWKLFRMAIKTSDVIWTLDRNTSNCINHYFPEKRVFMMPNPVQLSEMPIVSGLEKTIVFLGWVIKTKGIEELLQAWEIIRDEYPDYSLKLIGPYQENYISRLHDIFDFSGVTVTGILSHEDALRELAKCELFILPSYTEGFPNVILEAMALKKAIIATNVGAIPDILGEQCGITIEKKSVDSILFSIKKVLDNPSLRDMLGSNAYQRVKEQYCVEKVFERYFKTWVETTSI